MPTVADTSPLLALASINLLDLLPDLFGRVLIPPAVLAEATRSRPQAPGAADIRQAVAVGYVHVEQPSRSLVLGRDIEWDSVGPGEREAMMLALSVQADWLLLDDRRARRVATRLGLPVIGTVRVLEVARDASRLDRAAPLLDRLREGGFYISKDIVETVRKEERETRS